MELYYEIKDGKIVVDESYAESEVLNRYLQKVTFMENPDLESFSDEELNALMFSLTKLVGIIKKTSQIGVELVALEPLYIPEEGGRTSLMFAIRGENDTLKAFRGLCLGSYQCDVCEILEGSSRECDLPILVFKKEILADNENETDNDLCEKWICAIKDVEEVLSRLIDA